MLWKCLDTVICNTKSITNMTLSQEADLYDL